MWVVIFKARINKLDAQYFASAEQMRELAKTQYGCLGFESCTEGDQEIAISYWPDEQSIKAWHADPEHRTVQGLGKARWYQDYSVEVLELKRRYQGAEAMPKTDEVQEK